jgi:allantoin racemase
MRLLLLNANASQSITDLVVAAARPLASPETELIGATGRFGPLYIGTRAAYAIASHAALDAYAAFGHGADAVVLACFGDPGLGALREVASVPVVGMAEAGCRSAAEGGRRFAVVTGGARWIPMLTEYAGTLGLSSQLAGVYAVAPTGAEIAADPDGSIAMLADGCRAAVTQFHADVVVLGGAGLAPIAPRVAAMLDFPVIDGLAAAIKAAEAAASSPDRSAFPDRLTETLPAVGLTPELNALLQEPVHRTRQ